MPARRLAFALSLGTLIYNVGEGAIALIEGLRGESVVLLAFGADSHLEVLSAAAVMWRPRYTEPEKA
jgi:hypothetical protein